MNMLGQNEGVNARMSAPKMANENIFISPFHIYISSIKMTK
jgi:hypothetical protein